MNLKNEFICLSCGKTHKALIDDCVIDNGAINKIPLFIKKYGCKKPFIIADKNTYKACGNKVIDVIEREDIHYSKFIFNEEKLEPNEIAVGTTFMHFDRTCDLIIGIGSGVINDLGKILSNVSNLPYFIVGTAPSMDGYASATSSMIRDGLKISLPSKCANVIFGDIDILKLAPKKMIISGLGDMIAKYVSICEWRISNIINGEYYCEEIANIVRKALKKCIDNADKLLIGDDEAIKAVFEGLILGGVAMNYAGCSRPASGVEHYFSHIWDMRGLEFNTPVDFHGIQCAIGTLYSVKIYEQLKNIIPNKEKALKYVNDFNYDEYTIELKKFLGKCADSMIELEKKEKKYDIEKHKERLDKIILNWNKILKVIDDELIPSSKLEKLLDKLGAPKTCLDIGLNTNTLNKTFMATKDIRDKYVLSRLCFDLGIIDDITI